MSDAADERVFGLIAAAEDQQKMAAAVLGRLAAEEDALARERQLLAEDRVALRAEIAAQAFTAAVHCEGPGRPPYVKRKPSK